MLKASPLSSWEERIKNLYISSSSHKTGLQEQAWKKFLELGLPHTKQEDFRQIPLADLYEWVAKDFSASIPSPPRLFPYILPGFEKRLLVFIDGRFCKALSSLSDLPSSVVLAPLKEVGSTYGLFLQNQWIQRATLDSDPFTFLNEAFSEEGVFLDFPEKSFFPSLQILQIITQPTWSFPSLRLFLGKASQLKIYCRMVCLPENISFFSNSFFQFYLASQARLHLYTDLNVSQGISFHSWEGHLQKGAHLSSFQLSEGEKLQRNRYQIFLEEEGAEASLKGVGMIHSFHKMHTQIQMHHRAPHTTSQQTFKTAIQKGSSSFDGMIRVEPIAQKTQAYQLSKNLLLEEKSSAYVKPKLEILADDVKASHGATICKPSVEDLFYLQSRGISLTQAMHLLTQAFLREQIKDLGALESIFLAKMHSFIGER